MQYLIHNARTFLCGSAAAAAVMRYRSSLQLVLGTDSVDLPAIDLDGSSIRVRLRIALGRGCGRSGQTTTNSSRTTGSSSPGCATARHSSDVGAPAGRPERRQARVSDANTATVMPDPLDGRSIAVRASGRSSNPIVRPIVASGRSRPCTTSSSMAAYSSTAMP
jgi:hypothetical protein